MSPTAEYERCEAPRPRRQRSEPAGAEAGHDLRALLRAVHRWWSKERYRPERHYMRG